MLCSFSKCLLSPGLGNIKRIVDYDKESIVWWLLPFCECIPFRKQWINITSAKICYSLVVSCCLRLVISGPFLFFWLVFAARLCKGSKLYLWKKCTLCICCLYWYWYLLLLVPLACNLVAVYSTGFLSFGSFGHCLYTCEIKIISRVLLWA